MSGEGVRVRRATIKELGAAGELLAEYYEAIGMVKRDSPEEIAGYLSGEAGSRLWMASLDGLAAGCVVAGGGADLYAARLPGVRAV